MTSQIAARLKGCAWFETWGTRGIDFLLEQCYSNYEMVFFGRFSRALNQSRKGSYACQNYFLQVQGAWGWLTKRPY
jgi:hypothetical protein